MVKYYFQVPKAMNRLVIPAILAATVLVAGMFAFTPIEKASTVHRSVGTSSYFVSLDGVTLTSVTDNDVVNPGEFILIHDTTPVGTSGHVAVVGPCDEDEFPVGILTGEAPTLTLTVLTPIGALSTFSGLDDTFTGVCTAHFDFTDETDVALANITGFTGVGNGVQSDIAFDDEHGITIFSRPA